MEEKLLHYLDIINGEIPDDTNPGDWESKYANTPHKKKEQVQFIKGQDVLLF
jgi:hypothetical protein